MFDPVVMNSVLPSQIAPAPDEPRKFDKSGPKSAKKAAPRMMDMSSTLEGSRVGGSTTADADSLLFPEWDLRPLQPWPELSKTSTQHVMDLWAFTSTSMPSLVADIDDGKLEIRLWPDGPLLSEVFLFWSTVALVEQIPARFQECPQQDAGQSTKFVSITNGQTGWLFAYHKSQFSGLISALIREGCVCTHLQSSMVLQEKLAAGAYGVIKLSRTKGKLSAGEQFVVKEFHRKKAEHVCRQEAEMLRRIGSHPCILNFHGVFNVDGKWCLVTDYYAGGDLWHYCVHERGLGQEDALRILHCIVSGLAHVHSCNVFHRDVKPENVLMNLEGFAVLCDFGIATLITDKETMSKPRYTMVYASPEMLEGKVWDYSGDMYGAGATFHFMVTLQAPFLKGKERILDQKASPGLDFTAVGLKELDPDSRELLKQLLSREVLRPTAAQALKHRVLRPFENAPWTTSTGEGPTMLPESLCELNWSSQESGRDKSIFGGEGVKIQLMERLRELLPRLPRTPRMPRMPSMPSVPRLFRRKNKIKPANVEEDSSKRYVA